MGEQRNLTEENVEELRKKLEEMQQDNPDLEFKFFKQHEKQFDLTEKEEQPSNKKIFEKLKAIFLDPYRDMF